MLQVILAYAIIGRAGHGGTDLAACPMPCALSG